jgi:threonine aldolase
VVQAESHIYNDSHDCVQTLSHLNLVPLAEDHATFTFEQVEAVLRRAANGPYPVRVGAISIESPVRRMNGSMFDYETMKKIARLAREKDVKLHLDGARLFIASACSGIAPAEYAEHFDTVYVSLYKYFQAAAGAVLAGPRSIVEKVARGRKMFGSGVLHAWPYAAVALHYLDGFLERFRKAMDVAREMFASLEKTPGFRVEAFAQGTNVFRLHVPARDLGSYINKLRGAGILLRPPQNNTSSLLLVINESLNQRRATDLAQSFREALPSP